jgi:hypothetical protein
LMGSKKRWFLSAAAVIALIAALLAGCRKAESDNNDTASLLALASGNFSLVNSQTGSTNRLDILYSKTYSGSIAYIVSKTDLNISNQAQFNASSTTKTTKSITSDNLIYDDYIALSSLSSGTQYHVYILNPDTGRVVSLTEKTRAATESLQITGSFAGADGDIHYYINYPAGYNAASLKKWPLLISVKAPNFTANDPNFPCITFNSDINGGSSDWNHDIAQLRNTLNTVIDDPSYRINKNKIYACGYSAGGCAAMFIANNYDGTTSYTIRALAVNGISGWLGSSAEWTGNLGDTDIWISRGENDTYGADVAYENMPKTSGDHLLSIYPGVGHDASPMWASPYTFMWLLSK